MLAIVCCHALASERCVFVALRCSVQHFNLIVFVWFGLVFVVMLSEVFGVGSCCVAVALFLRAWFCCTIVSVLLLWFLLVLSM